MQKLVLAFRTQYLFHACYNTLLVFKRTRQPVIQAFAAKPGKALRSTQLLTTAFPPKKKYKYMYKHK